MPYCCAVQRRPAPATHYACVFYAPALCPAPAPATKYFYDAATDGKVALAALLCSSQHLQNDQAACEAVVL